MILQVYVGENLNYTVGILRSSDTVVSGITSDTYEGSYTYFIISVAIVFVMVFIIIILLVIVIICGVRKKSKKRHTIAFTGNTGVSMYASPAYGTHQVFMEPGLDHLYEPIDKYCEENTTTLKDTTSPASDDDEIDAEGYLKMKPSCEVIDQATTESIVAVDTCSTFIRSKSTDEYIQALDINLPASSIKDDDDGKDDDKNDNDKDDRDDNVKGDDKDDIKRDDKDDDVKGDDKDDDVKGDDKGDDRKVDHDDHDDNDDNNGDDKNDIGYDNNDQKQ